MAHFFIQFFEEVWSRRRAAYVKLSPVTIFVISGILAKSSSTKILLKKLFSDSAFSLSVTANVPSGLFNVGILARVFSFEWTSFQNCSGLCLLSSASFVSKSVLTCLVNFPNSFLAFVNMIVGVWCSG